MREVLTAFEQAVEVDLWGLRSARIEKWRLLNFKPTPAMACQVCGQPSDEPLVLAHLISLELGGSHADVNLPTVCKDCAARAQVLDWISWKRKTKALAPALAARRLEVLALSENHLIRTRDMARTKPYVIKLLEQRWQHPRFVVRSALTEQGGFMTFAQHTPMPDGIALLIRLNGGQPVKGAPRVFQVDPARFLDLVWLLIEHNARVRRVEVEAFRDPTPPDDGASRWGETYSSIHDIARRGKSMRGLVDPVAWHEKPMDPRTRLHLAAIVALKNGQPLDNEWLARHRQEDDHFLTEDRRRRDRDWLRHR